MSFWYLSFTKIPTRFPKISRKTLAFYSVVLNTLIWLILVLSADILLLVLLVAFVKDQIFDWSALDVRFEFSTAHAFYFDLAIGRFFMASAFFDAERMANYSGDLHSLYASWAIDGYFAVFIPPRSSRFVSWLGSGIAEIFLADEDKSLVECRRCYYRF